MILYHSGWITGVPGDLGVTLFFVISGFLVTWLLMREHERTRTISLREFFLGRTLRIFPAYYAFILLSVAADTALPHPWNPG